MSFLWGKRPSDAQLSASDNLLEGRADPRDPVMQLLSQAQQPAHSFAHEQQALAAFRAEHCAPDHTLAAFTPQPQAPTTRAPMRRGLIAKIAVIGLSLSAIGGVAYAATNFKPTTPKDVVAASSSTASGNSSDSVNDDQNAEQSPHFGEDSVGPGESQQQHGNDEQGTGNQGNGKGQGQHNRDANGNSDQQRSRGNQGEGRDQNSNGPGDTGLKASDYQILNSCHPRGTVPTGGPYQPHGLLNTCDEAMRRYCGLSAPSGQNNDQRWNECVAKVEKLMKSREQNAQGGQNSQDRRAQDQPAPTRTAPISTPTPTRTFPSPFPTPAPQFPRPGSGVGPYGG